MFKLTSFCILTILLVHTSCERSFTLVLDLTKSMEAGILEVRANVGQLLLSANLTRYSNFVLVPFKDTAVEPIYSTPSLQAYLTRLNSLKNSGGDDCPENSVAGIEAALRASEKQSTIFVFTDGYAKDAYNFPAVEGLCKEKHSQVIIFLSGYCLPSRNGPVGNVDVYYDIAKACSGALLKWDSLVDMRDAFRYMKEIVNTDWTNITNEKLIDVKVLTFTLDRFTSHAMLAVSGTQIVVEVLDSNLQPARIENVVRTSQPLVIRILPEVGEYTANIRGQGPLSVTFYKRSHLPFNFGFSPKSPRNLRETSARPIAGWTNYILIKVDEAIRLQSVEWLNLGESVKQVMMLKQVAPGSYVCSVFVQQITFRFWIIGEDNGREIKGSSDILSPQTPANENNVTWIKPEVEILDSAIGLVDFGSALTLASRVVAYPKPDVRWQDESSQNFESETILLEIPSVYISYVTIPNVSKNSTITCHVENNLGTADSAIDIYVNRTFTFVVLQSPEGASVEFGAEHRLYCEVDAYPEATLKWYLNSTEIDTLTNTRLALEDNMLTIKNMGFEDIGTYECKAYNDVESQSFEALIEITGVEVPEIEAADTEKHFKPSDLSVEIECRVTKGKPTPVIVWKYKSFNDSDFIETLPYGTSNYSPEKIIIGSVEKNHEGVYRCIASNAMGESVRDVIVKILSPPVLKNIEYETISVRDGDEVYLPCDVEATPEATVRWEMSQDDVMIAFDHRHWTDDKHTHHFKARPKDSGNYHCVAENEVGKAERTVVLNVLVRPYIEPPELESLYANVGRSVTLPCNVSRGNPAPVIRWEFRPKDTTTSMRLSRNNSGSALELNAVSKNDEGAYLCIAENQYGSDKIKYHLLVQ